MNKSIDYLVGYDMIAERTHIPEDHIPTFANAYETIMSVKGCEPYPVLMQFMMLESGYAEEIKLLHLFIFDTMIPEWFVDHSDKLDNLTVAVADNPADKCMKVTLTLNG